MRNWGWVLGLSIFVSACSESPGERLLAACSQSAPSAAECDCLVQQADNQLSPGMIDTLVELISLEETPERAQTFIADLGPIEGPKLVNFVLKAGEACQAEP